MIPRYSFLLSEVHMIKTRPYHCLIISTDVTFFIQTFVISAVGRAAPVVQRDSECSRSNACPHRYTEDCPVQKLNR